MSVATAQLAVRMPPGPPFPTPLQVLLSVTRRRQLFDWMTRRYGAAFSVHVGVFGRVVVVTDPALAREVFLADPDAVGTRVPNLITRIMGAGSVQGLNGAAHRRRRQLLGPPLHGDQIRAHQQLIVDETLTEIARWPDGEPFETYGSMVRITLNVVLRVLFGADGAHLDELRRIIPAAVQLGGRLAALPMPSPRYRRFTPWARLDRMRRQYDHVVDALIAAAQADPDLPTRTDVLSWLLRSRDEDGTAMSRSQIADELLTLLVAGHDTTAATLAWIFERTSRHPELLTALAAEADAGGHPLRRATIREVQRTRTVTDFAGRHVYAPTFRLGDWVLPQGCSIRVAIAQIHRNPTAFDDPDRFDPQRFLTGNPSPFAWLPYGGGARRCPGSALADLEMDVVLRTVLQHFTIQPSTAADEKQHSRGVIFTPARGGQIVVHRRRT